MTRTSKPIVMIVDDEAVVRELVQRYFTGLGYEVVQADCGEQGVQYAKTINPDLILMDVYMPGAGGIKTLRTMRESQFKMPIIMLTAIDDEQIAKLALEWGANDYLTKPIDLGTLKKVLETHLAFS